MIAELLRGLFLFALAFVAGYLIHNRFTGKF